MPMRLDALIAHSIGVSRKQARQLIKSGAVDVVGAKARADLTIDNHTVTLDGKPLSLPGHRYLMLHKPIGVVSSSNASDGTPVLSLLPADQRPGLHLVGRLDRDTSGLLLLTSDGQWSHRITSPRRRCDKVYRAHTAHTLTAEMIAMLEAGVLLAGERRPCLPAAVQQIAACEALITVQEGRYHQIRRMLAAVGNHVAALHRERIGALSLDRSLAPGAYRPLTEAEVALFQ